MLLRASAALLLALSATLGAQSNSDPGVGIGAHGAATRGREGGGQNLTGGIQARARLTGGIGLEALISFRQDEIRDAGAPLLSLKVMPLQVSGQVFFLSSQPVQPYLSLGGGLYIVRTSGLGTNEAEGTKTQTLVGAHAGVGVDVRVARRVSAFAEARYALVEVDAVSRLKDLTGRTYSPNYVAWSAGLNVLF